MEFLEATQILTKKVTLGECHGTVVNFLCRNQRGDLLHLEPRVLCLLEPGGFEPGGTLGLEKNTLGISLAEWKCYVLCS